MGKAVKALMFYFFLMMPVVLFMNNSLVLTADSPSVKHMKLASFLDVTYYESEPGILVSIFLLITVITVIYLITVLIRCYRLYEDSKAIKIILSFCLFFIGVFNDILVSSGFYNFIYISEYIFMFIIVVMGYVLQVNFVEMQQEVESLNANLEIKVRERTVELRDKQKKIEEEKNVMGEWRRAMDLELEMARLIQRRIIPDDNPLSFISAMFMPMAPIGGDFYDFIRFRENDTIGIFISDVSGHGVPAALVTTMIKSQIVGAGESKLNPAQLLIKLNQTLVKNSGRNFITAFYGIYDTTKRTITYSCAGHNPPFLIYNGCITRLDKARSIPLGIFPEEELEKLDKTYINATETLPAGGKILLYTDGLTEASGPGGKNHYFEDVMDEILLMHAALPCREFTVKLHKELVDFHCSDSFDDDVCIICVDIE